MSDYAELKRMIEDLVAERDKWKKRSKESDEMWMVTRERDDFNRCEAHLRGRKISKLQQQLHQVKDDLVKAERMSESLRKDAQRYRWLRNRNDYEIASHIGDELDRAIDSSMSKEP